jgi:hypothetical protein
LKEAMVDMLTALRGIGMVDCKQRLRGEKLLRLLAAIEGRKGMQKLDARNGQRTSSAFIVQRDEEREKESLLLHQLCIIWLSHSSQGAESDGTSTSTSQVWEGWGEAKLQALLINPCKSRWCSMQWHCPAPPGSELLSRDIVQYY